MSMAGRTFYQICGYRAGQALAKASVRALRAFGVCRAFRMPIDALDLGFAEAAGLMRLWQRMHWSSGDGMMPPQQLLAVYQLAATWQAEGDVVELGSWVGLTTSYLATACRVRGSGRVWAVDTFQGTKEGDTSYQSVERFGGGTLGAFRNQIELAGVSELVEPLVGFTSDQSKVYPGAPIRVLLIDADHSYDGVRRDFEHWSPLVAPGGLIIFHDYEMPEVARFVDELLRARLGVVAAPGLVIPNVMAVTKSPSRILSETRAPKNSLTATSHPSEMLVP